MLYVIGIAITFFLSFILLTKQEKSKADKILNVWLSVIGLHLIFYYLLATEKHFQLPYLLGLEIPMPLLHGPFIFLYTASLTNPAAVSKKSLLHFTPFLLGLLALFPFLMLASEQKIKVYQQEGDSYAMLMGIFFISIILSGIIYSVLSLRLLKAHKKHILAAYSSVEKINLRWLYYLIFGLAGIWLIVIFANDQYIFSSVVIYVMFIGYYGIKQVGIFTNSQADLNLAVLEGSTTELEEIPEEKIKYEKSELAFNELEIIYQRLTDLMHREKLYTTPELTLSDVAQKLQIHPNTLSQVINRMEEKNFFDYVNDQRVSEFKTLVAKPENQQFTLLSIAYECGFNSKTSFNRNFKKLTGISPSEYLKGLHIRLG